MKQSVFDSLQRQQSVYSYFRLWYPFYVLFVHVIVWTSTMSKHTDAGMTHAGILLFAQGQYLINASHIELSEIKIWDFSFDL